MYWIKFDEKSAKSKRVVSGTWNSFPLCKYVHNRTVTDNQNLCSLIENDIALVGLEKLINYYELMSDNLTEVYEYWFARL